MKIKKATVADSAEKGWRCLSEDETKELYGAGSIPHMSAIRFGAVMIKESKPLLSTEKADGWIIMKKKGVFHHYCCVECSGEKKPVTGATTAFTAEQIAKSLDFLVRAAIIQADITARMIIDGTCGSCKINGVIYSDTKLCLTCDKRNLSCQK